jgi:hypothetical protein
MKRSLPAASELSFASGHLLVATLTSETLTAAGTAPGLGKQAASKTVEKTQATFTNDVGRTSVSSHGPGFV